MGKICFLRKLSANISEGYLQTQRNMRATEARGAAEILKRLPSLISGAWVPWKNRVPAFFGRGICQNDMLVIFVELHMSPLLQRGSKTPVTLSRTEVQDRCFG